MTAAASPAASPRGGRSLLASVLLAGAAGGALDLVYATLAGASQGRSFQRVWQGVAGGWIGPESFKLGWASTALGLVTHFGIAVAMAGAFALAGARAPVLYRRPLLSSAGYGLLLYAVMYGVVLPLRWPQAFPEWDGARSGLDILAHAGVALAIVFVLRRSAGPRNR